MWRTRSWRTARAASSSSRRPCCSAPRTTAPRSRSSSPAATFRSSSSAASSSWRPPTSRTCWRSCAGRRICAIAWPAFASSSSCPAPGRRPPAGCSTASPRPAMRSHALEALQAAGRRRRALAGVLRSGPAGARPIRGMAGRARSRLPLVRARISSASTTTPRMRQADLAQLAQIASTYASRERFLTELTLDPPDATSAEAGVPLLDEDYLILSTIHSAKGQEWTSVFVLNAVDGCIPSDLATGSTAEIEEERRLLYVAMTRAKRSPASDRAAALLRASAAHRAATATCTPRARASFRPPSSTASRAAPGRSLPPRRRRASLQARGRRHRRAPAPDVELTVAR